MFTTKVKLYIHRHDCELLKKHFYWIYIIYVFILYSDLLYYNIIVL